MEKERALHCCIDIPLTSTAQRKWWLSDIPLPSDLIRCSSWLLVSIFLCPCEHVGDILNIIIIIITRLLKKHMQHTILLLSWPTAATERLLISTIIHTGIGIIHFVVASLCFLILLFMVVIHHTHTHKTTGAIITYSSSGMGRLASSASHRPCVGRI